MLRNVGIGAAGGLVALVVVTAGCFDPPEATCSTQADCLADFTCNQATGTCEPNGTGSSSSGTAASGGSSANQGSSAAGSSSRPASSGTASGGSSSRASTSTGSGATSTAQSGSGATSMAGTSTAGTSTMGGSSSTAVTSSSRAPSSSTVITSSSAAPGSSSSAPQSSSTAVASSSAAVSSSTMVVSSSSAPVSSSTTVVSSSSLTASSSGGGPTCGAVANPTNRDEFDGTNGTPLVRPNWEGNTAVFGLSNDTLRVFTDGPGVIVYNVDMGPVQEGSLQFGTIPGGAGDRVGLVLKKQATTELCDAVFVMWEPASNTVRVQLCQGAGPNVTVGGEATVAPGIAFLSARMSDSGRVEVFAGASAATATCVLAVNVSWTNAGGGGYVGIAAVGATGSIISKFGAQ